MNHGEKLRKIRIRKELSQEYVAVKIGKSQKTYSDLERKTRIDDEILLKILTAMEVSKKVFDNFEDEFNLGKAHNEDNEISLEEIFKLVKGQSEIINKLIDLKLKGKFKDEKNRNNKRPQP